jgi:Phage capsid protein
MAAYDEGLVPLYTVQYSTNLQLLLQQKGSLLRGKVDEGFHVGKMASPINQIQPITAKQPAQRFAPKNNTQAGYVRRWVFPQTADINQLVDTFDELQTLVDPKSGLVTAAAYAMGRAWDDCILAATTGTAQTGNDAGSLTAETFNTTNFQIAVNYAASGNVGLTVSKLIYAKQIFRHYHNDLDSDMLTLIAGSQQEADLLKQQQVVSSEYGAEAVVMREGKIGRFLGFNLVFMERVPQTTVGSVRGVIAFVKTGMYLGMWKDLTNRVSQRNDLSSEPWQVYTQAMYGSTRTQLGKVLQILCADTTGADINP